MNGGKMAPITALLRAAREQDEVLLKVLLENAAKNKNSEGDVNAIDCSGRVSYRMCIKHEFTNGCRVFSKNWLFYSFNHSDSLIIHLFRKFAALFRNVFGFTGNRHK